MHEFFGGVSDNHVLFIAFVAWTVSQVLKVVFNIMKYGRFDLTRLIGSGGMPSSHTAVVIALAVSIGREIGWDSTVFAFSVVMAFVVMYDAAGVRRAAGKQAEVINQMIQDVYQGTHISQERLKELIGHTPVEVLAGALLGVLVGSLL